MSTAVPSAPRRIDARGMVRALMAWARGERQVLSQVRAPSVEQEDARRGLRERRHLVKERTVHGNRIEDLLKTQGIMDFDLRAEDAVARLEALVTADGRPLGPWLKREVIRELERLALVMRQMAQVEAERDAVVANFSQACWAPALAWSTLLVISPSCTSGLLAVSR